ncbi:MAG: hypothetical protein HAW62_01465, partial [Endozoicomonadaceae bacterium]|nr:hypothetical protein [Endozoicomonadaceae bacterium]
MLIIRVTSFYQQKKENDMAYQHLTAEEISPSTISSEILRNTKGRKYYYQQAHQLAKERRLKASRQPYKML